MPRRRVLTEVELERLLALPTAEPDVVRHYTLSDADLAIVRRRRGRGNRLGFALQLCALRHPGRLLRPGELLPPQPVAYVAAQLGIPEEAIAGYARRAPTRYGQLEALRGLFGYKAFTEADHEGFLAWLLPVALANPSGVAVAAAMLEEMRRRLVVVPGPSVVERLVASAMTRADRLVAERLASGLSEDQFARLDALLAVRPGSAMTGLTWLRQAPGGVGHRALEGLLDRLRHVRAVGLDPDAGAGIHPERMRRLAAEGSRMDAGHLGALAPDRRRAVLVATLLELSATLTDEAVSMFDRIVGRLFRRAERREEEALRRDAKAINDKVRLFATVGDILLDARRGGEDPTEAIGRAVPWGRLEAAVAEAKALVRPDRPDMRVLAERGHAVVGRVGAAFLGAFTFHAVPAAAPVLRAVAAVVEMRGDRRRRARPKDLPTAFVRPAWRGAVLGPDGIDRRAYEACLLAELRDRLRAGDVWVEGSRRYRAVEDQLVPRAAFDAMRAAGPLPVSVPEDPGAWVAERRALMRRRLDEVEAKARAGLLTDVEVREGQVLIAPLKASAPEGVGALADRLYAMLPSVRITTLLEEVDRWTGFSSCLVHLRDGRPADDRRLVLTAVLADATNLGLTRMSEACDVATPRRLAWAAGWHLREETYGRALAAVVDAIQRVPLMGLFGAGTSSSSDGQHFPLGGHGARSGEVNAHHGGRAPTVAFYTHVSDRYAPFHTRVISATEGEAAYVLDGLLYHGAGLEVSTHHTDGGGVSDHVFALCHVLGFRFAPRIPSIGGRRLHLFDAPGGWPTLASLAGERVNVNLVASHWDDVLRLATSIRSGVAPASALLRRLGSYPRQNGLALALREVGRVERTLFTLDWLEDPSLRRATTAELNKGESRNALARAVCFHQLGRIRDRTAEAQRHRASGLALVVAAITLWNAIYLSRALEQVARAGDRIDEALVAHLSPLGWQHINLTGDYLWGADSPTLDGEFRPLRPSLAYIPVPSV